MATEKVIGIDLGTTYSALSIVNQYGKPEVLANREGERITPSVVFFDVRNEPLLDEALQAVIDIPSMDPCFFSDV